MQRTLSGLSRWRITAAAIALSLHGWLLILMLRPAGSLSDPGRAPEGMARFEVRLLPARPQKALDPPAAGRRQARATARAKARRYTGAPAVTEAPHATLADPPLSPDAAASTPSGTAGTPTTTPPAGVAPAPADGGFRQRLLEAQHGQAIHGVPGSDVRLAPGLQLTDPRNQGIGAVMRNAQRLFGVTSKHCIDVDVWSKLSTEERVARHLTPADVRAANEKYQCNRPLGLSF